MQTTTPNPRSAATAIAAVLALTATPALSQEASPPPLDGPIVNVQPVAPSTPVVAPAPAPAAASAPVIVLPEFPVEEPAPVVETREAAPPAAEPVARSQPVAGEPATRAAPAAVVAPVPAEPIAEAGPPVAEDLTPVAAQPEARPLALAAPTPEQSRDITGYLIAAFAALLALIGALVAFAVRRRRRSSKALAREAERVRQPDPRPAAPMAGPAPMAAPVPELGRAPSRPLRRIGAAVPLPARVPETFAERDALIRRMIDAPPDRANPFTDRRARLRRARLILQSLGRRFGDAKPWIDFSDYPENWPEFARSPDARPEPMRIRQLEPA